MQDNWVYPPPVRITGNVPTPTAEDNLALVTIAVVNPMPVATVGYDSPPVATVKVDPMPAATNEGVMMHLSIVGDQPLSITIMGRGGIPSVAVDAA